MHSSRFLLIIALVAVMGRQFAAAQTELTPWGNLSGIRIDGQLMRVQTSVCCIGPSMMELYETAKERQHPLYRRIGSQQIVRTELAKCGLTVSAKDTGEGQAVITIKVQAQADTSLNGVFLCFTLPAEEFDGAPVRLLDSSLTHIDAIPPFPARFGVTPATVRRALVVQAVGRGFRVKSGKRRLDVRAKQPTEIIIQRPNPRFGNPDTRVYLGLIAGRGMVRDSVERSFTIAITGEVDHSPVRVAIDARKPGRQFDGIGGNFRLQNEQLDPQVIDYCLTNLNIRWARVELPWRSWHPVEGRDPLLAARDGKLDSGVRSAMEMARRLSGRRIPLIVSAWYAPDWAIEGEPNMRNENGIFGNPLNQHRMRSIIKSIGSYFVYLKEAFGVEPDFFSFNEADLGINVRMTGQEHDEFIKKLGAYFATREISTKLLLGDNSDATTIDFLEPALNEMAARPYIGAISFHAWRGCDNWTMGTWADAARELNVPLLIGEGGTDAQAHQYPDVFREPSFAQDEIDIYVRACNVAHVRSVLQWQLTADYSLLVGGGIAGTDGALQPTRRFWNLKQLGMVAPASFILPAESSNEEAVSCASFYSPSDDALTVHLVNHGAERPLVLQGIPEQIRQLGLILTDQSRGMETIDHVKVVDGTAKFTLPAFGFSTLTNGK